MLCYLCILKNHLEVELLQNKSTPSANQSKSCFEVELEVEYVHIRDLNDHK